MAIINQMPQVSSGRGIRVYIYFEDHAPPHLHAFYSGAEALLGIEDQQLLRGSLPRTQLSLVQEWAAANRDDLMVNWQNAQTGTPLNKLPNI